MADCVVFLREQKVNMIFFLPLDIVVHHYLQQTGMARAQRLLGKDNKVIAVIGDGALTGGMALEALNDIGYRKDNLIIILNDNQMSICKNVGGLATYLNKLRMGVGYNKLKSDIGSTLDTTSFGKRVKNSLSKLKDGIKKNCCTKYVL